MKDTPRRRRQQQAAASLTKEFILSCNAFVIPHKKTKHGPRHMGKQEFAMAAIAALYPDGGLPERGGSKLTRLVNKKLGGRYQVKRQTVDRALKALRAANH